MDAEGESSVSFPYVQYKGWPSLVGGYVVDVIGAVLLAGIVWWLGYRDPPFYLAAGIVFLAERGAIRTLELRNKRIVLDVTGITRTDSFGRGRHVATWEEIDGLLWHVVRGLSGRYSRIVLRAVHEGTKPRIIRLWAGDNPAPGRRLRDALLKRLGFHEVTNVRPQSALAAAIIERQEYAVWSR